MKTAARFLGKNLSAKFKKLARAIPSQVTEALQEIGEGMKADFEKTVATWNDKPEFTIEQTPNRYVKVNTGSDIYRYLDEGTRVRYATMSPDFAAKTKAGWISSRAGRGGVMFINKNRPRPGIQARHFTTTIVTRWQPKIVTAVRRKLRGGIEAAGL